MAGEIAHVVYAARLLTKLEDKAVDPSYWAGTLFPDIRHLGVVSRHRTHPDGVTLTTLVGKDDFHTGMRVHAWIDATREKFLSEQHIKETLPWHPFVPHSLKLVEDEILYDKFDDWNLIHRTLNEVHDEERAFVDAREPIQTWHTLLQDYFAESPSDQSRFALMRAIGLSENSSHEVNSVVHMLLENPQSQELNKRLLEHFEQILS